MIMSVVDLAVSTGDDAPLPPLRESRCLDGVLPIVAVWSGRQQDEEAAFGGPVAEDAAVFPARKRPARLDQGDGRWYLDEKVTQGYPRQRAAAR